MGLQWGSCNVLLQIFGVWIALVQMSDGCDNKGWWECISDDFTWDVNADKLWEWEERGVNGAREWFH